MPTRVQDNAPPRAVDLRQKRFDQAGEKTKRGAHNLSPALRAAICKSLKKHEQEARCLHEPICIAFGTSVSSPTVPTYQLYDQLKTVEVRLYMESTDLQCVLKEISEWEQAKGAKRRRFLADLLEDKDLHDEFYVRLPDHEGQRRMRKLRGIIILPPKRVIIDKVQKDKHGRAVIEQFTLKYQHPCLEHANEETARGPSAKFVYCGRMFSLDELETYLVPRHWAAITAALKVQPDIVQLPPCPPGAAAPSTAVSVSGPMRHTIGDTKAVEEQLRSLAYQGGKCAPRALMMGLKMMDPEAFNELETALMKCDDGVGNVIHACCNSRVALQRREIHDQARAMNYLQDLDNLLISDKQHCWFKHGGLVIDPDDGTSMSFDEFAEENGAADSFVAVSVLIFETKAEALKWRLQAKKKKRQRHEEQLGHSKRSRA